MSDWDIIENSNDIINSKLDTIINIEISYASKNAIEKIKDAGGQIKTTINK